MTDRVSNSRATSTRAANDSADALLVDAFGAMEIDDFNTLAEQAGRGGEVDRSRPRAWKAYQGWLKSTGGRDSSALRQEFARQAGMRLRYHQQAPGRGQATTLAGWSAADEVSFRGKYALHVLQGRRDRPVLAASDQWLVNSLTDRRFGVGAQDRELLREFTVEGRQGTLADLVPSSTQPLTPQRETDGFERRRTPRQTTPTGRQQPTRQQEEDDVIEVDAGDAAPSPDAARVSRLNQVSSDSNTVDALVRRAQRPGEVFDAKTPRAVLDAYGDFLTMNGQRSSPEAQREFVTLMQARRSMLARSGDGRSSVQSERGFLANAALERLRAREAAGQSLSPRPGEEWMLKVLSDPKVTLSDADRRLIGKVDWRVMGLRHSLAEMRAEAEKRAEDRRPPPPGAPFMVTLNMSAVFDGQDAGVNAFRGAAKAAGYNDPEIDFALTHMRQSGSPLLVDYKSDTVIAERSQVRPEEVTRVGGSEFFQYQMRDGSISLRDARYAIQQGYTSVQEYQTDQKNTLSSYVTGAGDALLTAWQVHNRMRGYENVPYLGALVRGSYDAGRELVQVASNGALLVEMAGTTFKRSYQRGELFYTIAKDEEANRYFDNALARSNEAISQLGQPYSPAEEDNVSIFLRAMAASTPKMVTMAVPGAVIYYNALKGIDKPLNDLAAETTVDLLASLGGPLGGRFTSAILGGATRLAPGLINNTLASAVSRQVIQRGSSGVFGASVNVATDMGPTAIKAALGNASQEEINQRLTYAAFARNVGTGLATGLLLPDVHLSDDLTLLTRPGTSLAGPIYAVRQLDGEPRLFAPLRVTDDAGRVVRTEFVELDASNPKVKQAMERRPPTVETQANVDAALADSRFRNRYTEPGRQQLIEKANQFAARRTLADAEVTPQNGAVPPTVGTTRVKATDGVEVDTVDLLEARIKNHQGVNQSSNLSREQIVTAFGNGPYADELARLLSVRPFQDLARTRPDVAAYLYRAGGWTNVADLLPQHINNGVFDVDSMVAQVKALEPNVRTVGSYTVLENPAASQRAAVEVILPYADDHNGAFYQGMPLLDTQGKELRRVISDIPLRNQPYASQILGADGKPITDLSRTALLRSHGGTNGFAGLDNVQAAELMADSIITSGRQIDQVVLVACQQGERRAFSWTTNGREFQQAFREAMKKRGYDVQVRASAEGGNVYIPSRGDGQSYDPLAQRPVTYVDPDTTRLLPQGAKRDEKLAATAVGVGGAVGAGALVTTYVIYSLTKSEEPREQPVTPTPTPTRTPTPPQRQP